MKPIILVIVMAAYIMFLLLHNTTNASQQKINETVHHKDDVSMRKLFKSESVRQEIIMRYLLW